jgi:LytS/YehU family sensor histidine kinase
MHSTRQIATIAILAGLSIGTNYAMISLFNVKFMDLIVFVGGFCFGPVVGMMIGMTSWAVYGSLNPLGFSFPIWLSTMFSESIYGIAGAFARKSLNQEGFGEFGNERVTMCLSFAILGMLLTFAYDLITNIVFGYVSGWNILFAVIVGFVPFGIVHMASNAFFFGLGCVPAINAILKVIGGENSVVSKK